MLDPWGGGEGGDGRIFSVRVKLGGVFFCACKITWGFLWRGVGTTLAHGGEDEKKEPSREKGEKALWGAEGAGKRRRGRSRGVALTRGGTTRDCMTEVSKAACLHQDHKLACCPCQVLARRPLRRDWRNHLWWGSEARACWKH